MGTTLRPDRGLPVVIGGITFHFLYTFAVIDELQSRYDAPMSEILNKLTNDRSFFEAAGHMIEALIKSDLYNHGETVAPTFDQIMHVLTIRDTARIVKALFEEYTTDMPQRDEDDDDEDDEDPEKINIARLLIIGKTEMHMSEEEFWKTTPRKYFALFDEYISLKSGSTGKKNDIDELP